MIHLNRSLVARRIARQARRDYWAAWRRILASPIAVPPPPEEYVERQPAPLKLRAQRQRPLGVSSGRYKNKEYPELPVVPPRLRGYCRGLEGMQHRILTCALSLAEPGAAVPFERVAEVAGVVPTTARKIGAQLRYAGRWPFEDGRKARWA